MFLIHICMTSSIPDGVSFSDLQEMMKDALKEETTQAKKIWTSREVAELMIPKVMEIREEIGDISAYKHTAMYCLVKLFEFHNEVAMETMADEDEENELALCWARDAGWLQVCLNTLRNIGCGPNDFFTNEEEDEDVDTNN